MKKFLLGIVALIFVWFFFDSKNLEKDDYYEKINSKTFQVSHLDEHTYTWSHFQDAQDQSDEKVSNIIQSIVSGKIGMNRDSFSSMRLIYQQAMDFEMRDQKDLHELDSDLDLIFSSKNILEFISYTVRVEKKLGVDIFSNMVIQPDYQNGHQNIIYFYPITLAFGTGSDIFVNDDYIAYRAYVKRACVQLLKLYGYSDERARIVSKEVVSFYQQIGNHSKRSSELESLVRYYQPISFEQVQKIYSNLDMKQYFYTWGIFDLDRYSMVDSSQYQFLNDSLVDENLDLWKEVVLVKILSSYASYGGREYMEVVHELNQALVGTEKEVVDVEQANDIVGHFFSVELDQIYEEQVLSIEKKKYLEELTNDIIDYYDQMLSLNQWLSKETISKAREKLRKLKVHIGMEYENHFVDYHSFVADSSSLVSNAIEYSNYSWDCTLKKLGKKESSEVVSNSLVNAYYSPLDNSIYIPAAVFYLFDWEDDFYVNLGKIGFIIAHEITHGFDENGSLFDGDGIYSNWWLEEDWEHYEKLVDQVEDYYSQYEVIQGEYINGKKTVQENIADLGAMRCIVGIARKKGANDQDMKKVYSAYAKMWASQSNLEYTKLLLLQDTHAPNKYRVNAVLSSTDDFYSVYRVHFWDGMYVKRDQRVQVW